MSDQNKTKGQLIEELERLRGEVTALQKAAGDERRYAEEVRLLRTVIDNSPDWFFIKDRQHRFRLINQGFADLLGRRPEECIGKNDLELGFPEEMVKGNREKDIPGYWTDDQQVMDRGTPLINPYEPATLAGKNRVFHTIKTPIRDDDGHVWGLLGMVRDVTPSKQLLDDLGYRRTQLQTAAQVSRAATSILDPDELIRRVVDLARERFALYYVGLFLVDQTGKWTGEPGRWAVLRAGSGEAGQQMLAQGHRLKIGGESMIGWCVANKRARIALDVGEESVHFNNPFLPATRSEMALPLVSRGQIIGAMTVQSDQEAAFSDEDIAVFQTMADQLAIAIANARLLQETQQTVRELAEERNLLDTLMDSVPDMIFFKDAESRIIRNNRAHAKLLGLNSPEEAVGKTDFDLFSPEDAPRFYEEEQTIIRSGQPVVDRIGQTPDLRTGELRWLSETKVPLMDETGQAAGLVGIARDITERRQVEIELERRSAQLETAAEVSHAASSILDPDELIQQVGNLVQQQFNLYYAGLFLVDRSGEWTGEPGRWAVLRAGTGEAGRKMLEAGHKLEVGSESMIGWCIANAQARIALDVGEEAVRFVNPWLPETRSEMALPLISRGKVIGAVTIQSTQAAAFSQEDIAVLQAMADQLANSIENARLYTETKQRTQELSAALEVTTAVSSTLDLEEVLAVIAEQISKAIGVDGCTISQWDKAADTIVTWIEMRLDDSETDEPGSAYALNDFPATRNVLESGQPFALSVGDPEVDPAEVALMRTYGHLSLLMLPLAIGDRTIGLIELAEDKHERQFTAGEIRLCQALANQAAIAIENARLFEETQERLRELTMLSDVSRALAGASLRAEEIAEIITHQFVEVMGIPEASVSLLDPEAGTMRILVDVYVGEESAPSEGAQDIFRLADYPATRRAMETSQPLVVQASDPEADTAELAYMQEYGTVTLVIIPLAVKGQPIGVIELEAWDQERHYTPEQLNLATTMANQAAVALENARLFEQTQAALSEVEATHRAYLQREWQDYLHQGETLRRNGFLYDQSLASAVGPAQVTVEPDLWRPEMERALTEGHPATTENNGDGEGRSGLAVPIVLRGQTIGVLGLEDPQGNHQWSEEDQAMAEAVGRQLALALENARLLEETQRRVARERLTGEVTGRMRESLDLDTVLRTAVREIGGALELHDLTIRLEMDTDGAR